MILDLPIFSKSLAECQYHQYIILLYTTDGPRSMLFKMFTLVNEVNVFGLHDVRIMKALTYWPIISAEMFISRQCRYSILRPLSDDTGNKLILSHLRYCHVLAAQTAINKWSWCVEWDVVDWIVWDQKKTENFF